MQRTLGIGGGAPPTQGELPTSYNWANSPQAASQEAVSCLSQEVCKQDRSWRIKKKKKNRSQRTPRLSPPPCCKNPPPRILSAPSPQSHHFLLVGDNHCGCVPSLSLPPHLTCLFCDTRVGELGRCFSFILCCRHHKIIAFILNIHNNFLLKQKHEKSQTHWQKHGKAP